MTTSLAPLLEARNLGKQYTRRQTFARARFTVQAFDAINLSVQRGVTLAIVGESGAGKSSLARCLAFLECPSRGEILFEGQPVHALDSNASTILHRRVQFIFQNPVSALNPRFSAQEIVAEPLLIQRIGTARQQRERALDLMRLVGLSPESASKRALEFSGGQRQRLAIARALALEPELLILDEALSSLDRANQELILQLLDELQAAQSLTYAHICHDLSLVSQFAHDVAVMHCGQIVERNEATILFAHPEHGYTRQLLRSMGPTETTWLRRSA